MDCNKIRESVKKLTTKWNLYIRQPSSIAKMDEYFAGFIKQNVAPKGTPEFYALLSFTNKIGEIELDSYIANSDTITVYPTPPILSLVLFRAENIDKRVHQKLVDEVSGLMSGNREWAKVLEVVKENAIHFAQMLGELIAEKMDSEPADENPINP